MSSEYCAPATMKRACVSRRAGSISKRSSAGCRSAL
jgi:hypothetical protein